VWNSGLTDIHLNRKSGYVETLVEGQDPLYLKIIPHLPAGRTPSDFITSLEVRARKP